jgi:hypothetical protein
MRSAKDESHCSAGPDKGLMCRGVDGGGRIGEDEYGVSDQELRELVARRSPAWRH